MSEKYAVNLNPDATEAQVQAVKDKITKELKGTIVEELAIAKILIVTLPNGDDGLKNGFQGVIDLVEPDKPFTTQ